jgi:hypothetical protein
MKSVLKKIKRKIWDDFLGLNPYAGRTKLNITDEFENYVPASSGKYKPLSRQTINEIKIFPKTFTELLNNIGFNFEVTPLNEFITENDNKNAQIISNLFNKHGSDTAKTHGYDLIYSKIFNSMDINEDGSILEIGLGTNNKEILSNMNGLGKPGGSLKALRDFFPNKFIYGADIDREILIEDDRIKCFYLDQLNFKTFQELDLNIKENLDLIIDDGLHSVLANMNTLKFGLKKIKKGGFIVIEDINRKQLPLWKLIGTVLNISLDTKLIETFNKKHFVFLVKK